MTLSQILFILLFGVVLFLGVRFYGRIWSNIRLGKPMEMFGPGGERWKQVMLIAFGQKKMFKRWISAVLHLFIYVAFLFTQIELVEILIDGILVHTGSLPTILDCSIHSPSM